MKIPQALFETLPQALLSVFVELRPVDKVVEYSTKQNKKWGSRDRRFFAETCFEIVRHYRSYWVRCGFPPAEYLKPSALTAEKMQKILSLYFQDRQPQLAYPNEWKTEQKSNAETFAEKESYSDFLDQLGREELGSEWEAAARAMNEKAPVYLRVNFLKSNSREVQSLLKEEGIETLQVSGVDGCLKLVERKNVFVTQPYLKGFFEVQDLSSQKVVPLLEPHPGERVVDACAGAGGKTLHMASLMMNKGKIIALDIHQRKLDELRKRANRNGAMLIETKLFESTKTLKRMQETADALLLDVPCSGSGVIRRNPDTKWKFQEADWKRLLQTQSEILENNTVVVKPGGRMVYATCSIFPSENDRQIEKFVKANPNWEIGFKKTFYPHLDEGDGFFMALLHKI